MAAIYHPGVVQIVPHYDLGQPTNAANVTYWKTAVTGLTVTQLSAIRTAFDTTWNTFWQTLGTNQAKYTGSTVTDMSSNTGAASNNVGYSPHAGSATGGPMGDQVAYLLSLHGGVRYRGGHARLYIPGVAQDETQADGRTLTPTAMTSLTTLYTQAVTTMAGITGVNGGPLTPIIWHKKWTAAPNTIEDVFNWTANQVVATQRRRVRRISRHKKKP